MYVDICPVLRIMLLNVSMSNVSCRLLPSTFRSTWSFLLLLGHHPVCHGDQDIQPNRVTCLMNTVLLEVLIFKNCFCWIKVDVSCLCVLYQWLIKALVYTVPIYVCTCVVRHVLLYAHTLILLIGLTGWPYNIVLIGLQSGKIVFMDLVNILVVFRML